MRSLGSRLTYWYVLVVSVTVIVTLLVGRFLLEQQMIHGMDLLNAAEFQEIIDRAEKKHLSDAQVIERVAAHSKIDAPLYFFQLRSSDGTVVFRSANLGDDILPENPPHQANLSRKLPLLEDVRIGEYKLGSMRLQIAASTRDARRLLHSYFRVSLGMLGVATVLSVFFGYRLSRLALDPVRRIQQTAQRISAENLSERIPVGQARDEISDLSRLLNQMFDRLEVSFERLWRFAADASHELKTPLSLIRLQSEKLLMQDALSTAQQEAVQQQLESITRLDSIIEKLLFLARSEVGAVTLNLRQQGTLSMVNSVVEDAQVLCDEARVDLCLGMMRDCQVVCDTTLMRQVILNLLINALNATPPGGKITISSLNHESHWQVVIEDTGPGIPAERIQDIFEPFVRVPQGALREVSGGSGLGLAICRSILELHKGRIFAENRTPAPGLRVTFAIALHIATAVGAAA